MRISTIQAFNTGVRGIQDNYSAATRTQEQISSGKRILTPADDPVASVRLLQLDQEASKLDQYKNNLTAATNSLTQQEAVLNSVNNLLQRVREITLEAGNGALDAGGRQALAQELAEREDELFGLVNSQNARGEYLFGGFKSGSQPFVRQDDGSYIYQGDEGQRSIQIGSARTVAINDNGKELFVDISNAGVTQTSDDSSDDGDQSTDTVKRNVLDTVRLLREALENSSDTAADKSKRSEMLSVGLQNIDNAMNKVLGVQTSLGARLNVIESAQLENDEAALINAQVQSGLADLDYAEALSRLSMQSIVLEAAQQSFVKISGLSLFNYLR